jgi:hypothetical protein
MRLVRHLAALPDTVWTYLRTPPVTYLEQEHLCACRYPRRSSDFEELVAHEVSLLVNLHERGHPAALLERFDVHELHLPVPDFGCPTAEQIDAALLAIERTVGDGHWVAVHCGGGLGRTGTLLACYFVRRGLGPSRRPRRKRRSSPTHGVSPTAPEPRRAPGRCESGNTVS